MQNVIDLIKLKLAEDDFKPFWLQTKAGQKLPVWRASAIEFHPRNLIWILPFQPDWCALDIQRKSPFYVNCDEIVSIKTIDQEKLKNEFLKKEKP